MACAGSFAITAHYCSQQAMEVLAGMVALPLWAVVVVSEWAVVAAGG